MAYRKYVAGGMSAFWMVLLIAAPAAVAAVINVGPGQVYTTIQSAVDAADSGDEVVVADGTYNENVLIERRLTLRSVNGAAATFVAAAVANEDVIRIDADNVRVSGFTVYGATAKAGIGLSSGSVRCVIEDNRCGISGGGNYYGIYHHRFSGDSNLAGHTISGNVCKFNVTGIYLFQSDGNIVRQNEFSSNAADGIFIDKSDFNQIEDNDSRNNTFTGVYLQYSNFTSVLRNDCAGGTYGIRIYGSEADPVSENRLVENFCYNNSDAGFYLQWATDHVLIRNTVLMSGRFGLRISNSRGNLLWLNNLMGSADRNVSSYSSTGLWSGPLPLWYTYGAAARTSFLGNYYDDHDLFDGDGDGVADAIYPLPGDEPEDFFPLAKWSNHGDWNWSVVSSGMETISTGLASRAVAATLTVAAGAVTVDGGLLAIGGLW